MKFFKFYICFLSVTFSLFSWDSTFALSTYWAHLEFNKGVFLTNKLDGSEYAVVIKKWGFGFEVNLFERRAGMEMKLGSAYLPSSETQYAFDEPEAYKPIIFLETGPKRGEQLVLIFEKDKLQKIKFGSQEARVYSRPASASENLIGSKADLQTLKDFFAQNEGRVQGRDESGAVVSLTLESGVLGGFSVRTTRANESGAEVLLGGRSVGAPSRDRSESSSSKLELDRHNTFALFLDTGLNRGKTLFIRLNDTGHISSFRIQPSRNSKATVSCRQLTERILFAQPFR